MRKAAAIRFHDLRPGAGCRIELPGLGDIGDAAWIFLDDDVAVLADGHVVEFLRLFAVGADQRSGVLDHADGAVAVIDHASHFVEGQLVEA
ncbi:MAG: hypothetical protein IPP85_02025 [Propionivibrio sp.]|nr:hypothetical protein [Propionivibrio sp.]